MGILFVANRRFERQWFLYDLQNLAHLVDRHPELFPELFRRWLTTDLVEYLTPVCTENLNPDVVVMKPTEDRL